MVTVNTPGSTTYVHLLKNIETIIADHPGDGKYMLDSGEIIYDDAWLTDGPKQEAYFSQFTLQLVPSAAPHDVKSIERDVLNINALAKKMQKELMLTEGMSQVNYHPLRVLPMPRESQVRLGSIEFIFNSEVWQTQEYVVTPLANMNSSFRTTVAINRELFRYSENPGALSVVCKRDVLSRLLVLLTPQRLEATRTNLTVRGSREQHYKPKFGMNLNDATYTISL